MSVHFEAFLWPSADSDRADAKGKPIFELDASTAGLATFPSNASDVIVYGAQPIPGSGDWPRQMRDLMERLLTGANLAAFQLFRSQPVEIEPRPYFVDPD